MESVLDLPGKQINTFLGLKELARRGFTSISLANNKLTSFEHFGTHPNLWELRLESNRIVSFLGMTKQRSLESLHLAGNPVASHPNCRIMALLTIGFSLKTIDGVKVDAQERELARRLGPNAALAVSYGWLLDLNPKSAAEYDEIISEVRRERRLGKPAADASTIRTIAAVLSEEASKENLAASGGQASGKQQGISSEAIELQNKALVHLSNRVAQLERQLMMAELELSQERSLRAEGYPMQHQRHGSSDFADSGIEGLSVRDVRSAESIQFVDGIVLRTNVELTSQKIVKPEHNVCLVIDRESISFRHSFTRARIVDCPLSTVEDVQLDLAGHVLLVVSSSGAVFDVHVTDEAALICLYKLLFLRRGLLAPAKALRRKAAEQQRSTGAELANAPQSSAVRPTTETPPAAPQTPSALTVGDRASECVPIPEGAGPARKVMEPDTSRALLDSSPPAVNQSSTADVKSETRPEQPAEKDPINSAPKPAMEESIELKVAPKEEPANQRPKFEKAKTDEQKTAALAPQTLSSQPSAAPAQEFTVSSDSDSDDEIPVVTARSGHQRQVPAAQPAVVPAAASQATPAVTPSIVASKSMVGEPAAAKSEVAAPATTVDPSKRQWRGKMIKELLVDSDSDE